MKVIVWGKILFRQLVFYILFFHKYIKPIITNACKGWSIFEPSSRAQFYTWRLNIQRTQPKKNKQKFKKKEQQSYSKKSLEKPEKNIFKIHRYGHQKCVSNFLLYIKLFIAKKLVLYGTRPNFRYKILSLIGAIMNKPI